MSPPAKMPSTLVSIRLSTSIELPSVRIPHTAIGPAKRRSHMRNICTNRLYILNTRQNKTDLNV